MTNFRVSNIARSAEHFVSQLKEIDHENNKINFFAEYVTCTSWVLENPKTCKKAIKYLLQEVKNGSYQLDPLIDKTISFLGTSHQRFYGKIFSQAASKGLTVSCSKMVEWGVLDAVKDKQFEKIELDSFFLVAAEGSIEMLDWLKSSHPSYLQEAFCEENSHLFKFLETAIEKGSLAVLQWLYQENSSTFSQLMVKKRCGETLLHEVVRYQKLVILQWFAEAEPDAFKESLSDQTVSLNLLQKAAYRGFLPIFEWLHRDFSDAMLQLIHRKASWGFPAVVEIACCSFPLLQWIENHYPEAVSLMVEDPGSFPLHTAAKEDGVQVFEWLKAKHPQKYLEQLEEITNSTKTTLLHDLAYHDSLKTLQWLYVNEKDAFTEMFLQSDKNGGNIFYASIGNGPCMVLQWLLTEFPSQSDQWVAEGDRRHKITFASALTRMGAVQGLKIVLEKRRSYFESHLEEIFQGSLKWDSWRTMQLVELLPEDLEDKKFELQFRAVLPGTLLAIHTRSNKKALALLKCFLNSPYFTVKEFNLNSEQTVEWLPRSYFQLAFAEDDPEVFALLYQHHPQLLMQLIEEDSVQRLGAILYSIVRNEAASCCRWLCIHMQEYISMHIDAENSDGSATPLEMALGLNGYKVKKAVLEVLKEYLPQEKLLKISLNLIVGEALDFELLQILEELFESPLFTTVHLQNLIESPGKKCIITTLYRNNKLSTLIKIHALCPMTKIRLGYISTAVANNALDVLEWTLDLHPYSLQMVLTEVEELRSLSVLNWLRENYLETILLDTIADALLGRRMVRFYWLLRQFSEDLRAALSLKLVSKMFSKVLQIYHTKLQKAFEKANHRSLSSISPGSFKISTELFNRHEVRLKALREQLTVSIDRSQPFLPLLEELLSNPVFTQNAQKKFFESPIGINIAHQLYENGNLDLLYKIRLACPAFRIKDEWMLQAVAAGSFEILDWTAQIQPGALETIFKTAVALNSKLVMGWIQKTYPQFFLELTARSLIDGSMKPEDAPPSIALGLRIIAILRENEQLNESEQILTASQLSNCVIKAELYSAQKEELEVLISNYPMGRVSPTSILNHPLLTREKCGQLLSSSQGTKLVQSCYIGSDLSLLRQVHQLYSLPPLHAIFSPHATEIELLHANISLLDWTLLVHPESIGKVLHTLINSRYSYAARQYINHCNNNRYSLFLNEFARMRIESEHEALTLTLRSLPMDHLALIRYRMVAIAKELAIPQLNESMKWRFKRASTLANHQISQTSYYMQKKAEFDHLIRGLPEDLSKVKNAEELSSLFYKVVSHPLFEQQGFKNFLNSPIGTKLVDVLYANNRLDLMRKIHQFTTGYKIQLSSLQAAITAGAMEILKWSVQQRPICLQMILTEVVSQQSETMLRWIQAHYPQKFPLLLDRCLFERGSLEKYPWLIEKLTETEVEELCQRALPLFLDAAQRADAETFDQWFEIATQLMQLLGANLSEDALVTMIHALIDDTIAFGGIVKLLEIIATLPLSKDKKFMLTLKIDLICIPRAIARGSVVVGEDDDSDDEGGIDMDYHPEERLIALFSPEHSAHMDIILPQLLAHPSTVHYLLSSRPERLAELLSFHGMAPDIKLRFLPLLPPSEIDELTHLISEQQLDVFIRLPQLVDEAVTIRRAIELCFTELLPQIDTDMADTCLTLMGQLFRSLPFEALALAAKNPALQIAMLKAIKTMGPVQQVLVIPQIKPNRLVNYLRSLPLNQQAALLGMATVNQKIKYLQSVPVVELMPALNSMKGTLAKRKREIAAKIQAFQENADALALDRLAEMAEVLDQEIMKLKGQLAHFQVMGKSENRLLFTQVASPNEMTVALTHLIAMMQQQLQAAALQIQSKAKYDIEELKNLLSAACRLLSLADGREPPAEYLCLISHELMEDPVKASDGQIYDRKNIQKWLSNGNLTSPVTRAVLIHELTELPDLKEGIEKWKRGETSS